MINGLDKLYLENMYLKAKNAFKKCMTSEGNEFLSKEIDVPYNEIILKDESVTIQFLGNDINHYIVEAKFVLFSRNNQEIGWYSYQVDENGEVIDDYLVFD